MEAQEYFEEQKERLMGEIERQLAEFSHNIQTLSDTMQQVVAVGQEYIEMEELWAVQPRSDSTD